MLLLVLLPLSFELVFLSVLGLALKRVETVARVTERSRAIVASSGRITEIGKDACMNFIAYHMSRSPIFTENREALKKQIDEEVTLIRDLVGDDKVQLHNVEVLKASTDQALKLLSRVEHQTEDGGDSSVVINGLLMKGEIETVINGMIVASNDLGKHEDELRKANIPDEGSARKTFETVLVFGIFAHVIVTILAVAYLARNFSYRLKLLIDNTMRMAAGKEFTPPVGGNDEIAQLDATFREMAKAKNEADKMKREFLEMVSHDVRTPLMSVSATLEMIGMGLRPNMLNQDIEIADRNITQVLDLLSELLDLHRLEAGKLELALEEADVLAVLTIAIETVRPNAEKLGVTIYGSDVSAGIMCDQVRLRQVLINLLSNSVKFSPKGGEIRCSIDLFPESLKITISDQGPGIPREFKDKIFERFGQVRDSDSKVHGGKGLGLAISRALIEAHAGRIGVDSEEGKGSDFWIVLPRIT